MLRGIEPDPRTALLRVAVDIWAGHAGRAGLSVAARASICAGLAHAARGILGGGSARPSSQGARNIRKATRARALTRNRAAVPVGGRDAVDSDLARLPDRRTAATRHLAIRVDACAAPCGSLPFSFSAGRRRTHRGRQV